MKKVINFSRIVKYCTKCLYPETKPSISFNEHNVCNACQWYEVKEKIYDKESKKNFSALIKSNKKNPYYDCIVPVSGGKDSVYQVWRVLNEGFNPLCVTASTDYLTDIGRRNIENIKSMGVDHIEISPNIKQRRKINRYALENVGDVQWPEHILIFTIPVHVSVQFEIPIIIWGENSVREYGGGRNIDSKIGVRFDKRYLEENCGLNGLRVSDLINIEGMSKKDLNFYTYPDPSSINRVQTQGIFLDDYFPWNGESNQLIARTQGFEVSHTNILGTLSNYENLDNYYHGIHDYIKFLKYGYGRATDIANNWIRRGMLSRHDALLLIKDIDGSYPSEYLGKSLQDILNTLNMSKDKFDEICDDFTNYELFEKLPNGKLKKRSDGSPILKQSYI